MSALDGANRLRKLYKAAEAVGYKLPVTLTPLMTKYITNAWSDDETPLKASEVVFMMWDREFLDKWVANYYAEAKSFVDVKNPKALEFAKKYAIAMYKYHGGDLNMAPPSLGKLIL